MHSLRSEWLKRIALFILALAASASAGACPVGSHDNSLTLSQVMQDFGHFLLLAGRLADKGLATPSSVTRDDFQQAVISVQAADECVYEVLNDQTGTLIPDKASDLSGAARDAYLKLFRSDMSDFGDGLQSYIAAIQEQEVSQVSARDYQLLKDQEQKVDDLATKAHGDLQ